MIRRCAMALLWAVVVLMPAAAAGSNRYDPAAALQHDFDAALRYPFSSR